jgi:hypothetical protein
MPLSFFLLIISPYGTADLSFSDRELRMKKNEQITISQLQWHYHQQLFQAITITITITASFAHVWREQSCTHMPNESLFSIPRPGHDCACVGVSGSGLRMLTSKTRVITGIASSRWTCCKIVNFGPNIVGPNMTMNGLFLLWF